MVRELTDRQQQLAALCRAHGVQRLDAFGSAVRNDFNSAGSDIDLIVRFGPSPAHMDQPQQYSGLLAELESLFGRPVDPPEEPAIQNRFMLREINRTTVPLYAA